MKKSKVLTSFIALSLLVGVSGCSSNSEPIIEIYDPYSLIEAGASTSYTLVLTIDEYISSSSITRSDYEAGDYDIDNLKGTLSWDNAYIYTIYYTNKAVLCDFYIEYQRSMSSHDYHIYINDDDKQYGEIRRGYYSTDGVNYQTNGTYYGYYQDAFYSLEYFTSFNYSEDIFTHIGTGVSDSVSGDSEYYDRYELDDSDALRNLAYCCGLDWAYPDVSYEYDLLTYLYLNYYNESKEMSIGFYEDWFELSNSTGTRYALIEDRLDARFIEVGNTNIDDVIKLCLG